MVRRQEATGAGGVEAGVRCLGLVLFLVGLAACSPPSPRHVVLVSIDSLRADRLGLYGYGAGTSPNLDRIAAEGLVFDRVISSTSWTLPAHVALFTGQSDSVHGVLDDGKVLGSSGPATLAERLGSLGFATGAVVSGPYLHRGFGVGRGFDDYLNCMGYLDESFEPLRGASIDLRTLHEESHSDVTSPCVLRKASEWIREHREEPTFLFLHFWDVHFDYLPPAELLERFDPDYRGDLDASDFETNEAISIDMSPRDRRHLDALYDAEIAFVDRTLGQLMTVIDEVGQADETLVAVTADHGEAFFEHGVKGHRKDLHAEVVRIPLVWWGPGVPRGERRRGLAHITDIAPTVLDLVGASEEAHSASFSGRSLTPLFSDPEAFHGRWVRSELTTRTRELLSFESLQRKIVVDRLSGRIASFDLERDPGEERPMPPSPEDLRRLERSLREVERERENAAAETVGGPPPEVERELRALGYIE